MAKSFENFFYKKENRKLKIQVVSDYADYHEGAYEPYKGMMFCPECKRAELTFVHKTSSKRAYLKRIPSAHHLKGCYYTFDYAPKKLIKEYMNSLTDSQVQDKLNAMMNVLFNNKSTGEKTLNERSMEESSTPFLISSDKGNQRLLKVLRRKNLSGWIDKMDETISEELHLFYGKVKLSVEKAVSKNNYPYNRLVLRTQNKDQEWKFRGSIYRGNIQDDIDEDAVYQIVLIGNFDFEYKLWSLDLVNSNAIQWKRVKE